MPRTYTVKRVVKFKFLKSERKKLKELEDICSTFLTKTGEYIYSLLSSNSLALPTGHTGYIHVTAHDQSYTWAEMREQNILGFSDFVDDVFEGVQVKYWRGILQYVVDRYKSFGTRNRAAIAKGHKSLNRNNPKQKEIQFKNQIVSHDPVNCTISFEIYLRDFAPPFVFKYEKKGSFLLHVDGLGSSKCEKFGGNLVKKQGVFSACCTYDKEFAYDPVAAIGIDLNKDPKSFFQLSKKINGKLVFSKPDSGEKNYSNMTHVERVIKFNNDKLLSRFRKKVGKKFVRLKTGERPFSHRQARPLRKKNKSLHKHHRRCTIQFLDDIGFLDAVEENKLLLCIDKVATGQNTGTFGQDKINAELIKQCENRGIPFIAPPTANTSRRCPQCNHVSQKNRKSTDHFECVSCGHEEDAQFVGAFNIERTGLWLWNNHYDTPPGKWRALVEEEFSSAPLKKAPRPPVIKRKALKAAKRPRSEKTSLGLPQPS